MNKKIIALLTIVIAVIAGLVLLAIYAELDSSDTRGKADNQTTGQTQPTPGDNEATISSVPIPGNVRECYELAIGTQEYGQIQTEQRSATEQEQAAMKLCHEQLGWDPNAPDPSTSTDEDLPDGRQSQTDPDDLASASGTLLTCLTRSLGSELAALQAKTREPSQEENRQIENCVMSYGPNGRTICELSEEYEYDFIHKIITYESAGLSSGSIADSSAVLLDDGKIRVYFGWTDGIMSAISDTAIAPPYENISFTVENGLRVSGRFGHPRVTRLDDDSFKLFVRMDGSLYSFSGTDGLSFTQDVGIRLDKETLGFDDISGPGIVQTGNSYELYISNLLSEQQMQQAEDRPDLFVKSASSTDLINWTVDQGIRLGRDSQVPGFEPNDQDKVGQAEHPAAIATSGGEILVAFRGTNVSCISTSANGTDFTQPVLISDEIIDGEEFSGGDPDILELEPDVYLVTGTRGGPTPEGHIRMSILRKK